MQYMSTKGPAVPAPPLFRMPVPEQRAWQRNYERHREHIKNSKSTVDMAPPRSYSSGSNKKNMELSRQF